MMQLSSVSNDTTLSLVFSIGRKILLQRDVTLSELVTYQWNLELMLKKGNIMKNIPLNFITFFAFHLSQLCFFFLVRNLHLELYSEHSLNYDLAQTQLNFSLSLFLSFSPAAAN